MDKIILRSASLYQRCSKRLEAILVDSGVPIPPKFKYVDALAVTLGFFSHKDYLSHIAARQQNKTTDDERRDEDLPSSEELASRRRTQATAFQSYCNKLKLNVVAEEIIAKWRPTSARPNTETLTPDDIERYRSEELPWQIASLLDTHQAGNIPLVPEQLEIVRKAIKSSEENLRGVMQLDLAIIALQLGHFDDPANLNIAISIFEFLVETGLTPSAFNLAQALIKRERNAEDLKRAHRLLLKVKKALDDDEQVFVTPDALRHFYSRGGSYLLLAKKTEVQDQGIECLEKAAELGCIKATNLLACLYHGATTSNGIFDDLRKRIKHPEKAAIYFDLYLTYWYNQGD